MLRKIAVIGIAVITLNLLSCRKDKAKTVTSSDIFRKYSINNKASYFNVPPGIVSIFLDDSKKGNKALKDLLSDVKQLSILIISSSNKANESNGYQELNHRLDSINFSDLAQINNGRQLISVKAFKEKRNFNELVVFVSNSDALYCISFKGEISPKKVVNLIKQENVVAVTNLNRFNI